MSVEPTERIQPVVIAEMEATLPECKKNEHVHNGFLVVQNPMEPRLPALAFYPEMCQNKEVERRTSRF